MTKRLPVASAPAPLEEYSERFVDLREFCRQHPGVGRHQRVEQLGLTVTESEHSRTPCWNVEWIERVASRLLTFSLKGARYGASFFRGK